MAEAKGAKIETVTKEKDEDDETVYWADVAVGGRTYAIGVLEDGTLTEMNLAVDDEELPFDRCPAAVQATFRSEAFGEKVETVGKDMKYGVTIYETVVEHKGKSYEIVVAEDGTLVEKVLVIDDEEVELAKCPAAVQVALREHAKGGKIGDITRSTGIGRAHVRGRGRDQGQGLLDRGLRERPADLQVARGRRRSDGRTGGRRYSGVSSSVHSDAPSADRQGGVQLVDRALNVSARPGVTRGVGPWLLSCMLIPCKVRRAWLIRASD